jgi:hypothetical protein
MEEDRMSKKIFTQELEATRRRRPRKGWREEVERDLQVLGVRRWRELVIGKNGEVLFDRPKPTAGCSANERRRVYFSAQIGQHSTEKHSRTLCLKQIYTRGPRDGVSGAQL